MLTFAAGFTPAGLVVGRVPPARFVSYLQSLNRTYPYRVPAVLHRAKVRTGSRWT